MYCAEFTNSHKKNKTKNNLFYFNWCVCFHSVLCITQCGHSGQTLSPIEDEGVGCGQELSCLALTAKITNIVIRVCVQMLRLLLGYDQYPAGNKEI